MLVSFCCFYQFEMMVEMYVWYVWIVVYIDIFFMEVQIWFVIMGDVFVKNGDFVVFFMVGESFMCFVLVDFFFNDVVVFFSKFMYLFFECFDIFLG